MEYFIKASIILTLLVVIVSLFSALYHLLAGNGGPKMAKALTIRISLSLSLFLILFVLFYLGILKPHQAI